MCDKICGQTVDSLRLSKGWHSYVRNAVLNVVGIVRIAMLAGREALIQEGATRLSWRSTVTKAVVTCRS